MNGNHNEKLKHNFGLLSIHTPVKEISLKGQESEFSSFRHNNAQTPKPTAHIGSEKEGYDKIYIFISYKNNYIKKIHPE